MTPDDFAPRGIASVVERDGMLVADGRGNTIDIEAQEAAVNLSDDGLECRKVETSEGMVGQMIDVVSTGSLVPMPAGVVAVGGGGDMAGCAWHSTDGLAWQSMSEPHPGSYFHAAPRTSSGLIMAGARRAARWRRASRRAR